jgi:hypothetical protein
MANRFAGVPRGRALSGSKAISAYMFNTPKKAETVVGLDRAEFGLVIIGRELTGFTGWIDHALARRAGATKIRRGSKSTTEREPATASAEPTAA